MIVCSSQDHRDDLESLLSGDLPEAEQARLTTHLDTCDDCRKALDGLAARSGLWGDLSLLRSDEPNEPRSITTVTANESPDDEELPLGLLETTDEPGLLGRLGSYDILRVIGRGGMGVVFLGRDRALDRLAIKVLTPSMSATPAARRRFAREAKAAAAVVHEHVVAIQAVESLPQDVPYLVMQYIAGKSVQDVIDRDKTPELAEILRIGAQAANALAAAHAQGLIHRDVKSHNRTDLIHGDEDDAWDGSCTKTRLPTHAGIAAARRELDKLSRPLGGRTDGKWLTPENPPTLDHQNPGGGSVAACRKL